MHFSVLPDEEASESRMGEMPRRVRGQHNNRVQKIHAIESA
jgi:hypothetical protein